MIRTTTIFRMIFMIRIYSCRALLVVNRLCIASHFHSWPSWCVPPVETQAINIAPPEHPCRFPFPFSFFSSFFLSFLSFSVFPFLRSFFVRFVLSSCRFPFVSCISNSSYLSALIATPKLVSPSSLSFSLPCFPWLRILLFCYFVSALHPPRAPCEPEVCAFPLRAVFFLAFLMLTYFIFSSLPSLFRFRFGHRLFHPVFFLWVLD